MAQYWLWQILARLFKGNTSTEVPSSPEHYLELARKCVAHARKMTSTRGSTQLQFNHGQCEHLAIKLEWAVSSAESCVRSNPPGRNIEEAIGIFKHLYRCAKQIETFIQSCRQAKWVQAAVVLTNVYNSEHVSSLDFDLDLSQILAVGTTWEELLEVNELAKSKDLVNEIGAFDQRALLSRLEAMNHESSELAAELHKLVKCLLQRLRQQVSRTVDSEAWEIDLSSLQQVQKLASGSFGTVRKSIWLDVEVAEKRFHGSDDQPDFRNEVQILAGLTHPNIVRLLGYGMDEGGCSIVMELMDEDLKSLMDRRVRLNPSSRVPFSTAEAVDKMLQTAEGVLYLHENKVVHRDLKSQNILVKCKKDVDGEYIHLKVADFGLSKTKEKSSSYSNLTMNIGTTRWMAPELMRQGDQGGKELRYPFKVDVYSFGMVCIEILTGKIPFSSTNSSTEVRGMVLEGKRPQLPVECTPDLNCLIAACWDSNASQRPSFATICRELRRLKFLLMGGSQKPIAALREQHEDRKRREARQKKKMERAEIAHQKGAEVLFEKKNTSRPIVDQCTKRLPKIVEASRWEKRDLIAWEKEIAERDAPLRVEEREARQLERDARQQEREEREAAARQKIREARHKELEERKESEFIHREKIREARSQNPTAALQVEHEDRKKREARPIVVASEWEKRDIIAWEKEIAERDAPLRVKEREARQLERDARQQEREEREAAARQKIREARHKELEERKETESIHREKIREARTRHAI